MNRPKTPTLLDIPSLATGLALAAILSLLPAVLLAQHPNHPLGVSGARAYQQRLDQIDHVDLFSGSLGMHLAIGPLTLAYTSNVWRYEAIVEDGQLRFWARPDPENNAGIGWQLGWGEVYGPQSPYNPTDQWMFVDDTGARHLFYQQLHRHEDDGDDDYLYTRDGSYLRLILRNNFYVDIESPDGTTRRYDSGTGGLATPYLLSKVWNRHASAADPDLSVTYSSDYLQWTLQDRHGRTHYVHFTDQFNWITRAVDSIDLESFQGQRAVYDFQYLERNLQVSCKDTSAQTPATIEVPFLARLVMPDGSSYEMLDDQGEPDHHLDCWNGIADASGVLRSVTLPTGGRIQWEWQEYEFPPGDTNSPFNTSVGVHRRHLVRVSGQNAGTWSYRSHDVFPTGDEPHHDPYMVTEITYPAGHCGRHYFNARYWQTPSTGRGWEYGLPFIYTQGGQHLSSEMWTDAAPSGACTGTKLRTRYASYRADATPGSGDAPASEWYDTNRQMQASRTVFHDDGNRYIEESREEFDGLGHFRRVVTTGNLRNSPTAERRVVYTHYNRTAGTYPGSYVPVPTGTAWVLGLFDRVDAEEPDAAGHGQSTKRVVFELDPVTGHRTCSRVLADGYIRGPDDLLTVYERDGSGQVTAVKRYGGDLQTLSTAGSGCGPVPAGQPRSWTEFGYEHGARAWSRQRAGDGTPDPFYELDLDIDPHSGLPLRSRDKSGYETSFDYDALARLVETAPAGASRQTHQYTIFGGATSPAKLTTRQVNPSAAVIGEQETVYDEFGRPTLERVKRPDGGWAERQLLYDTSGHKVSVSQWGDFNKKTLLLDHDPFGRVGRVVPPSGSGQQIRFEYQGIRRVEQYVKRVTSLSGQVTEVTAAEERDRYGRLVRVEQPSGPLGTVTASTYTHDVGDRVVRIQSGVQTRTFAYDNRGFLLSQSLPEKYGPMNFAEIDVDGRPGRVTDNGSDLGYTYDAFGRLTEVRDRSLNRVIREHEYDGGLGFGLGKPWKATRYNWVDIDSDAVEEAVEVREVFDYQGAPGGRVDRASLTVVLPDDSRTYEQRYEYHWNGAMRKMTYGGQSTDYGYEKGLLENVTGWVTVGYHPSLMRSTLTHSNGVVEHQDPHSQYTRRIGRLYTTGASQNWDSGVFAYDGAGNPATIGSDSFAYDAAGRLVDSETDGYQQAYSYDAAGNLLEMRNTPPRAATTTVPIPADPATNRLASPAASYDAAGNMTAWMQTQHAFDAEHRLMRKAEFTGGAPFTESFAYTAAGERVFVQREAGGVQERMITERSLDGRVLTERILLPTGDLAKRYVWAGPLLVGADGPDGRRHYHLDRLGNVRLVTDDQGQEVESQNFLPYGDPLEAVGDERMQFTGHERDGTLDYMHQRYYQRIFGRFMRVDPAVGDLGNPLSLNRYAYVEGNPATFMDPTGFRKSFRQRLNECRASAACRSQSSSNATAVLRQVAEDAYPSVYILEAELFALNVAMAGAGAPLLARGTAFAARSATAGFNASGRFVASHFGNGGWSSLTSSAIMSYGTALAQKGTEMTWVDFAAATAGTAGGAAAASFRGSANVGALVGVGITLMSQALMDIFGEIIEVVAPPPTLPEGAVPALGDPDSATVLVCAQGNSCVAVTGTAQELDNFDLDAIQNVINAEQSLLDLGSFHCLLSATTCNGGGSLANSIFCPVAQGFCANAYYN